MSGQIARPFAEMAFRQDLEPVRRDTSVKERTPKLNLVISNLAPVRHFAVFCVCQVSNYILLLEDRLLRFDVCIHRVSCNIHVL